MALLFSISKIFLLVPSFSLVNAFSLPSNNTFSKWDQLLETKMFDLVVAVTQIDFARSVYESDPSVTIENVNGEEVLKSVLKKITELLQKKKTALRNLVDKAEELFMDFQNANKSKATLDNVSFVNMKALKPADRLEFNSNFRQKISYDDSGIHIPLEIYDGYTDILNGLNWTAGLDKVFRENRQIDPSLKWQYFGSFFGFMRVYPAFRWPDHPSLPDLFDVRRRSWYIQGSATPKDVIILIDRSGSVHGPTLDIIKITARALLNSLGENDYVNVAWFNNKVKWIVPCLNTLVQATAQIRRLLGDAVEQLTESNLTSYATALDFAFEAFKKFDETKKPWSGSNCHKIIMFLSDGGTEWPSDLITNHCNESKNGQIKIFTFACGPHPIPTVILKEMACATGGYFSPITALGSVRVKIQDYVRVLSRPLAYSEDENLYRWHNFYRDIGGLGIVTTVTLPVFNKSHKANSTHLLGVMGIDILVEEMTDLFPKHFLGSFGYPFAINTNGFVLFHPRLHDHIVYIEDPPNIYLTDLEGSTEEIEQMEKSMIDGLHGSLKNIKSIMPVGTGHGIVVNMDYFYGSIEPSTFRFGVAIPPNNVIAKIKISDLDTASSLLSMIKGTLLAPWKFCAVDEGHDDLTVEELVSRIQTNYSSCDENLINHLLWDVKKVLAIQNHWNQSDSSGVWSRILITSGGLTTVFSSFLTEEYQRQGDPLKNNLYKRAIRSPNFVFSVGKGSKSLATVAARITIEKSFVAAVIGAEIEQGLIQQIFNEVTGFGESENNCDSSEMLHCYLLNDGGTIVATNIMSSKVGNFIGVHDAELLNTLLSEGILQREYRYTYQSWCSKDSHPMVTLSASHHTSVLELIYESILAFHWNLIFTSLFTLFSSAFAWKKVENTDPLQDSTNHSCVIRSAWYYHSGMQSHSDTLGCAEGKRSFRASFLTKVSLIFVVAEPPCNDSQELTPITLDSEEDVEPHYCSQKEHYRLRPGKCYSQLPKNIFSDCGATSKSHIISGEGMALVAFLFLLQLNTEVRY